MRRRASLGWAKLLLSEFEFLGNLVDLLIGTSEIVVRIACLVVNRSLRSNPERRGVDEGNCAHSCHRGGNRGSLSSPGSQRISSHLCDASAS